MAAAAVAPRRPRLAAAMVAPYAGALAVACVSAGRRVDDAAARALLPAAFLAMHVGWGVGVWSRGFELLRRRVAR
jgi:succinoglycan biosynthesis protein ExoA